MKHLRNQRLKESRPKRASRPEDLAEIEKLRAEVAELRSIIVQIGEAAVEHLAEEKEEDPNG